uniref:Uncharacterized protein n=1 Tax=Aegilops tauschii subsp. strangulata TaxID=200361 RepID=A0A453EC24_AEGTS
MGTPCLGIFTTYTNMEFPSTKALVWEKAKKLLLLLALVFSLALFLLLVFELASPHLCEIIQAYYAEEGHHQVEITGIDATPQDATCLRLNLAARVTSRYQRHEMCVTDWETDVWHDGTHLGKAYFPKTCLEKMTEAAVTATTSTELAGLSIANGTMLQVEMTQFTNLLFGDDRTVGQTGWHWQWCKATLGGQSHESPSPCRIHHLTLAETSDRRFSFRPGK